MRALCAALLSIGFSSPVVLAAPEGGEVRAGSAEIKPSGLRTDIIQSSPRVVIDWRSFNIALSEHVNFSQPSVSASTLNRVKGEQVSMILGRLTANGQVVLVNPNGIVFGKGAQVNVGSLIASTTNISDKNFMEPKDGRLVFDQPATAGAGSAGIVQSGTITATEGGLVALVAPHVRNDGLIQARLGKVTLASGDSFTIDLVGDQLYSLALSKAQLDKLVDRNDKLTKPLIDQAGTIDVSGGKAMLVTAATAKAVLDNIINMSGTIVADSASTRNGQIVLLGKGGEVNVSGELSAAGRRSSESGGDIQVVGESVKLSGSARLDAWGAAGGGSVQLGGAGQAAGASVSTQTVDVGEKTIINVSAALNGNGGSIVAAAEEDSAFHGSAFARGGGQAGGGGTIEISSGKSLTYDGVADAGAPSGKAGTLLLGSERAIINEAQAKAIGRTLRTGTTTAMVSARNVALNSTIDGRGGVAGGGLRINAQQDITLRADIFTNSGAVDVESIAGKVTMSATPNALDGDRKAPLIHAGGAPISLRARGNVFAYELITRGKVVLTSIEGDVTVDRNLGYVDGIRLGGLSVCAGALCTDENVKAQPNKGNVTLADVRVQPKGEIKVAAYGHVWIQPGLSLDSGQSGFRQAANEGGSVAITSRLLGNLWASQHYRNNPMREYDLPRLSEGEISNLDTYPGLKQIDLGSRPGLTPPSPTSSLPKIADLAPIIPPKLEVAFDQRPLDGGFVAPDRGLVTPDPAAQARRPLEPTGGVTLVGSEPDVSAFIVAAAENGSRGSTVGGSSPGTLVRGGRGIAQNADLGRSAVTNAPSDVFTGGDHVVEGPACDASGSGGVHGYFGTDTFGSPMSIACW